MSAPVVSAAQQALLFIPDISGFTQFVNETEIAHSQHIIQELLEQIIDANDTDLVMAEVEGDAVLFYRTGSPPTTAELLAQVQRMFISFHAHLKRYETHRICQCGACCTAVGLTLKFFCHYGEVTVNKVKDHHKPFGRNVILVHRLMKNDIQGSEYALFTQDLMDASSNWVDIAQVAWAPPANGEADYDAGKVRYSYVTLEPLKAHVPAPTAKDYSIPGATEVLFERDRVVEAPLEMVFDVVSDLSFRHHWFVGLRGSDRMNHKIMQQGSSHRCVVKDSEKDPFLISHNFDIARDVITFVESNHREGYSMVIFLRRLGKSLTRVELRCFVKRNVLMKLMFNLFMRKKMLRDMAQQLENLNDYCKKLLVEGRQHPSRVELGFD